MKKTYRNLFLAFLCIFVCTCAKYESNQSSDSKVSNNQDAMASDVLKTASPAAKPANTQIEKAPGGTLFAIDGKEFALENAWKDQRAIIVFYRGHW